MTMSFWSELRVGACAVQIWPETAENDWRDIWRPLSCNAFAIAMFSSFLSVFVFCSIGHSFLFVPYYSI